MHAINVYMLNATIKMVNLFLQNQLKPSCYHMDVISACFNFVVIFVNNVIYSTTTSSVEIIIVVLTGVKYRHFFNVFKINVQVMVAVIKVLSSIVNVVTTIIQFVLFRLHTHVVS